MKQIIQNQTISFDTHQAGDGQEIEPDQLHMHKKMNGKKFKGVNIRIPLNPNKPIDYSGNNSKDGRQLINEIKGVFKKDPNKVRQIAKLVANRISRYTKNMTPENSKEFLDNTARALATHFELNDKIMEVVKSQIESHLSFYVTQHIDENGKFFYIKQDIDEKTITLSDKKLA